MARPATILAMCALAAVCLAAGGASSGEITDAAGRRVTIPDEVGRVFAAGPPAAVVLFTLAPDKLLGWTRAFEYGRDGRAGEALVYGAVGVAGLAIVVGAVVFGILVLIGD